MRDPAPTTRWAALAVVGVFFVSVAEMVFMVSPFAAYFYGVFSPVLGAVQGSPALVWLSAFWISHIAFPNVFLDAITIVGGILVAVGLLLFIVHAVYLYWKKFARKEIADWLLYARVRHPQYTALIICGLGLAISWPRFLNLVLFCVMVGAYYTLARFEESRMEARFGDAYREYAGSKAMFFPGSPGRKLVSRVFGWAPFSARVGLALTSLTVVLLAGAFAIRAWSVRSVPTSELDGYPATLVIDFSKEERPSVEETLASFPSSGHSGNGVRVLYLLDDRSRLEHLLLDSGIPRPMLADLDIPESELYVVAALATYVDGTGRSMSEAAEALSVRALRKLEAIYTGSGAGGDWTSLDVPADALPGHANLPVL